jgi:YD repeat-containing protein
MLPLLTQRATEASGLKARIASVATLAALGMAFASHAAAAVDPNIPPAGQAGWYPTQFVALNETHSMQVNVANGNLIVSAEDLAAVPATYHVTLSRTYNSRALADTGLGKGWRFDSDPAVRLTVTPNTVTGAFPDGAEITFTRQTDGSFTAPDGSDWTLASPPAGGYSATNAMTLETLRFDASGTLQGTTDAEDRPFTVQYTSGNGRTLLGSKGTQDGRRVNLSYDGVPRVRLADDPASNKRDYRYDTAGRLTEYQQGAALTTYGYDAADRLTSINLPDGTTGSVTYNADGWVSAVESRLNGELIDAFTVTYGPADAPCLATDIGKSTVTNTGDGTTVSYCITADGRGIDRSPDENAPGVEPSGTLEDRVGDYVGNGFLDATVTATDDDSGIASIRLIDGDGQPIGLPVTAPGCPSDCPETFDAGFLVNTASLGDGAREIIAVATDAAGNTNNAVVSSFYVDTVAPGLAYGIREDEYDSETGTSIVRWLTPNDPDLADGSLGAGSASSKVRYKVGSGAFTENELADDEQIAVPAAEGQEVTVEVRARDARGNESSTASITYTAGSSDPSEESTTALRSNDMDLVCAINVHEIRARATAGNPEAFIISSRRATFELSLFCGASLINSKDVESVRIDYLQVARKINDGEARRVGGILPVGTFSVRNKSGRPLTGQYLRGPLPDAIGFRCDLDPSGLSGNHTYVLDGTVTLIKQDGTELAPQHVQTNEKDFRCPSSLARRGAEDIGWNALLKTHADGHTTTPSSGSAALARALGDAPYRPRQITNRGDAWEAHHIVPKAQKAAAPLRRLLFRCQVHPNQNTNGVWLRSTQLRKTPTKSQPSYYRALQAYDRQRGTRFARRAYHPDTYAGAYANALKSQRYFGQYFDSIYERTDCTAAKRAEIRDTLGNIEAALRVSSSTLGGRVGRN